jgi:hypothetical protein
MCRVGRSAHLYPPCVSRGERFLSGARTLCRRPPWRSPGCCRRACGSPPPPPLSARLACTSRRRSPGTRTYGRSQLGSRFAHQLAWGRLQCHPEQAALCFVCVHGSATWSGVFCGLGGRWVWVAHLSICPSACHLLGRCKRFLLVTTHQQKALYALFLLDAWCLGMQ